MLNQAGSSTWPMAHMIYLVTIRAITATDCTVFQEYFKLLSWTQLNDRAVAVAASLDFVALPTSFRTYFFPIDIPFYSLRLISCLFVL